MVVGGGLQHFSVSPSLLGIIWFFVKLRKFTNCQDLRPEIGFVLYLVKNNPSTMHPPDNFFGQ